MSSVGRLSHVPEVSAVETDALDEPLTVRDMLTLVHAVRDTKPRDGLRAVEDALLDLVGKAGLDA